MRTLLARILIVVTVVIFVLTTALASAGGRPRRPVNKATVERWIKDLSNWGRWGKNDQLGAINLITQKKRRQAAALVREGVSFSLARNLDEMKSDDNGDPFEHRMINTGLNPLQGTWCLDHFGVAYHGFAHTHMDALCHIFHDGKMFNGFSQEEVTDAGTRKLAISNLKSGIFTRAILMDIPRLKGVRYLEPGTPIFPEDLEAWEKKAGIKVGSGDAVLIRTGRWTRRAKFGPWSADSVGAAGLHVTCMPWLRKRDIALLGSDAASDVLPSGVEGVPFPVHLLTLYAMGVPILDNADFEELSKATASRKRWEFLLTMAPLRVEGGTGSPLNPIATF